VPILTKDLNTTQTQHTHTRISQKPEGENLIKLQIEQFFMRILNYYPKLTPDQASKANLIASSLAGMIFFTTMLYLDSNPVLISLVLIAGMLIDSATVPYVHSGVISRRYRSMKYSKEYFMIHVPSASIAYGAMVLFIVSMFTYRVDALYTVFVAFWSVVYVSGVYGYFKVRGKRP